VNTWTLGLPSDEIQVAGGIQHTNDGLYLTASLTFEDDGAVSKIEGDFHASGPINFLVRFRTFQHLRQRNF